MKRNLAIILLTCLLVSCLALFAACNTNAHTHTVEKVDAKAATCLTEGNEEYYRCTGCDKLFSDEGVTEITAESVVIAALGHDEVNHDGKPATCTEDGYEAYVTCSRCDYTTYKKIDKIPHVYDQEVVDEKYLAAEATVTAATYYKSCVCGAKGTETFTHGDPLTPDPEQIKIEAETGVLTGTPMYGVASMVESSVLASGGQELGCFCNNGNTATWTVTLNESHEDATLSFSIRSWATTEDMSGVKITVNGEELAWRDGEKFKATDVLANVYKLYHSAKFSVAKGELVIKIEIIDNAKANCNFDYLTVNFTEISLEDTSPDPREDASAVKAEAEHAVISGTSQYPAVAPNMIETSGKASGGKEIGCFAVNDNTAKWTFTFADDAENVVVYFYAKSFIDGSTENFGIYVDDVKIEWFNEYFMNTTNLNNPYKFYASKPFNVTKGERTVTLKVLDATDNKCAVNFDYIMLAGYGDVKVDFDGPDLPESIKIEAESGNVTGTSQYPDYCATMIESNDAASGGAEIGCFAVNGNTATWTVVLDKDYENLSIDFTMKSYVATEDMSGFKLTVNGKELSWNEGVKLAYTQPNYADYSTAKFSAEAGELVITIEVVNEATATANIDYLTINLA